jgi:hypothetical protein
MTHVINFHAAEKYIVRPFHAVNRLAIILMLSLSVLIAGCSKPDVKYSDLSPAITASVSDHMVIIHLSSDLKNSACWTQPEARVDGLIVYVVGYRT